jgi:hypothetical protein
MRQVCSSCERGQRAARDLHPLEAVAGSVTARGWHVAVLVLLPGLSLAQGLGEAARNEADRRKARDVPRAEARVYSNADLPSRPEDAPPADVSSSDGEDGANETASQASDEGSGAEVPDVDEVRERLDRAAARRKEQEREWRARAAAARLRLEAARREHDAVCKTGGFSVGGG